MDIIQSNARIAEVRVFCDQCGKLIGTRLMPKTQAEAQKNTKVVCQSCKEEMKSENKKTNFSQPKGK